MATEVVDIEGMCTQIQSSIENRHVLNLNSVTPRFSNPPPPLKENRDYKTVIREPLANNLAHMLNE